MASNRHLPIVIFVVALVTGLVMTLVAYNAEKMATTTRFERISDETADRVRERVSQHIAFLQAAHSFLDAYDGRVSKASFSTFIKGLNLTNRLGGVQGIGFARLITRDRELGISQELRERYGIDRQIWPESTDQDLRTPIVLLEPDNVRNQAALGYDMYSDPIRRMAMKGAISIDGPTATAPVELVQEITSEKQSGFLVYMPAHAHASEGTQRSVIGFVYAPFRAGDLHKAVLEKAPRLPIVVETNDVTEGDKALLYRSPEYEKISPASVFSLTRSFNVAGRAWQMSISATPAFGNLAPSMGIMVLAAVSFVFAAALALSARAHLHALDAARRMHAASEKSLHEKDLMLREMKHRIKNAIARVMAIARQTAARADTIEDFTASFMSRLQAMSNAQDMLTRSHSQCTDLRQLLSVELEQVLGTLAPGFTLTGEPVELNEKATQALGLVFHELATNALKYGGLSDDLGRLDVEWKLTGPRDAQTLTLTWAETSPTPISEPDGDGFGTRLVDANIRAELGGRFERHFAPTGLTIRLTVPKAVLD